MLLFSSTTFTTVAIALAFVVTFASITASRAFLSLVRLFPLFLLSLLLLLLGLLLVLLLMFNTYPREYFVLALGRSLQSLVDGRLANLHCGAADAA